MDLKEILDKSPEVRGYGGGKWAMYSTKCCWWTSYPEDMGRTSDFPEVTEALKAKLTPEMAEQVAKGGALPCCPHCGNVLMQADLVAFIKRAMDNPGHYREAGLEAFAAAHSRNSTACFRSWDQYKTEEDPG